MATPAIAVRELKVSYGATEALKGVSFDVDEGCIFGLLGPNGGGKTTLFRVLSTLLRRTAGTAQVAGHDVSAEPAAVRRKIGVVFQSPSLDKVLTVDENLRCQGALYGLAGADLSNRIADVLARLKVSDRARERVATLSGGLKRRIEIAKGLLHGPRILLLDEPTTGLDPGARRDVWAYLAELRDREKATVLVTTHLMDEAEKCDRLAILHQGMLVGEGVPDALRASIGGDVIVVEAPDAESLATRVSSRFGQSATASDSHVRIERKDGHRFIPELVDAFPGEILSVKIGKPTLEDVFLKKTGHRFFDEDQAHALKVAESAKRRRR